jgi:hypothetical protein
MDASGLDRYEGLMIQKIEEYVIVGLVALVGILVAALGLEGGRLHKAQVTLLEQKYDAQASNAEQQVTAARQAFLQARQNYLKAGGKV